MQRFEYSHRNFQQAYKQQQNEQPSNGLNEPILWKLVLISALAYIIWSDKISIVLGDPTDKLSRSEMSVLGGKSLSASIVGLPDKPSRNHPKVSVSLPAGALNNVTFAIDPDYADRNGVNSDAVNNRQAKCKDYVERFAPVAIAEMRRYGIPASVILAQGLLESNAGESTLAKATNNHFGIKCFSSKCAKGHCMNFTDDSHKDFFVKYPSAWGSFRAHSEFLKSTARYKNLFALDHTDYAGWAKGLGKTGYATDKTYGNKLIAIIENLGLDRYDNH